MLQVGRDEGADDLQSVDLGLEDVDVRSGCLKLSLGDFSLGLCCRSLGLSGSILRLGGLSGRAAIVLSGSQVLLGSLDAGPGDCDAGLGITHTDLGLLDTAVFTVFFAASMMRVGIGCSSLLLGLCCLQGRLGAALLSLGLGEVSLCDAEVCFCRMDTRIGFLFTGLGSRDISCCRGDSSPSCSLARSFLTASIGELVSCCSQLSPAGVLSNLRRLQGFTSLVEGGIDCLQRGLGLDQLSAPHQTGWRGPHQTRWAQRVW